MAAATKTEKKRRSYPWKAGTSSGHITKLKQSIFAPFDIYDSNIDNQQFWGQSYNEFLVSWAVHHRK
jgi:hypothetical protein